MINAVMAEPVCYKGIGFSAAARYEEGVSTLAEAVGMLAKTGNLWESISLTSTKAAATMAWEILPRRSRKARTTFETSIRVGEAGPSRAIYSGQKRPTEICRSTNCASSGPCRRIILRPIIC